MMKGKSAGLAILIASFFMLSGCKPITKEDLIPKELGEPEGLWLYKGNERMRTDGSEREFLFDEIELGGEIVSDFFIDSYLYCPDASKAFFSLSLETEYFLYCFDYQEKRGQVLWETENEPSMEASQEYVYVETVQDGRLYLHDGTLLSSEIGPGFYFRDGLLFRMTDAGFTWWRDGLHSVELTPGAQESRRRGYGGYFVQDDRFGFIGLGNVYLIDLEREELTELPYEGRWNDQIWLDGWKFFLTYSLYDNHTPHGYRLYALKDGALRLACTFPSEANVSFLDYGNGYINFLCSEGKEKTYCYYSNADGELHEGSIPIEKKEKGVNVLICGEYSFWVTSRWYGGAWVHAGYCYYLNRKHGGKEEIIQYSFENDGHFFDDIREE